MRLHALSGHARTRRRPIECDREPVGANGGATASAPSDFQLVQDDRDRRRDRRRGRRDDNARGGGGDGVYSGGRSRGGDGVYTGGGRGNQGTVFCNPTLGCVRDLNINPGSGLGR